MGREMVKKQVGLNLLGLDASNAKIFHTRLTRIGNGATSERLRATLGNR
jgi:hypothetical protein